jgi:acetyltransferase-like isoleucine patch superfamily enzyme
MQRSVLSLLRALWQFRSPALLQDLGERRQWLELRKEWLSLNPQAKLHANVVVNGDICAQLRLGPGSAISHGTVVSVAGAAHGRGQIRVGEKTWIGEYNNLRVCDRSNIEVGDDCLISQFCTLVGSNHRIDLPGAVSLHGNASDKLGVVLGNGVWLGAGSSVLPGVRIGDGAVVAAGSVVTRDVAPNSICAGVPARTVGSRTT